jgi:hypothetical protein
LDVGPLAEVSDKPLQGFMLSPKIQHEALSVFSR